MSTPHNVAPEPQAGARPSTVAVIGLGNIGSQLVSLVARLPHVERIVLVDHDIYEGKNLFGQHILPSDVGRPKAVVQSERVRSIDPQRPVEMLMSRVESTPMGGLRGAVLVTGLDTRISRMHVNRIAWRLGCPMWIDTGVRTDGLLARVNVWVPGADRPCLECGWGDAEYAALEQAHPCADPAAPAATDAPAALGALAAALGTLELQKLLAGRPEELAAGKQVLVAAGSHRHFVTTYRRNPDCRFDHCTWPISTLNVDPDSDNLADLQARAGVGDAQWCVDGQVFARILVCPGCGTTRDVGVRLSARLGSRATCACGRRMAAPGTGVAEALHVRRLAHQHRDQPLSAFGFEAGDVVTARSGKGDRHFQLGEARNQDNPQEDMS